MISRRSVLHNYKRKYQHCTYTGCFKIMRRASECGSLKNLYIACPLKCTCFKISEYVEIEK